MIIKIYSSDHFRWLWLTMRRTWLLWLVLGHSCHSCV